MKTKFTSFFLGLLFFSITGINAQNEMALNFDGTNERVKIEDPIVSSSGNVTIEMWYMPQAFAEQTFYQRGDDATGGWSLGFLQKANGKVAAGAVTTQPLGYWLESVSTLELNKWYHIALTWNRTTGVLKLYVNGTFESSYSFTPNNLRSSTGGTYVASNKGSYHNCMIDELRFWTIVKEESDIRASMYSELIGNETNLVAYYDFNETTGTTLPDLATGDGAENGTLVNMENVDWVESYAMVCPVNNEATSITPTGFNANWTAPSVGTVNNYYLEVATDAAFTSKLASYDPYKDMGTSTSEILSELSSGTTYYYRVRAYKDASVGDVGGFHYSAPINVTTFTESTFNGTGSWTESARWSDGIPSSITNVTLNGYCTISSSASCNNILIKDGASLIGQGNLTVNGTTTVERYISGYSGGQPGWHFLSSPVQNLNVAASDFVPGSGIDDLYEWDEATNMWLNYFDGFNDVTFDEGKGYLIAYSSAGTKTFSGTLNSSTEVESLSYNPGTGDGWNLLGNPYPSAIDWDLLGKTGGVLGTAYVIQASDGAYINWNGSAGSLSDGIIPPNQGFFVQALAGSQTVTMETTDQVHSSEPFYKSNAVFEETLVVSLKGLESENSTYFQFRDDATYNFDYHADAYKLFGWATIAQVYSELDDVKYDINCLPHSEETITVPLGLKLTADESLTLDFSGMESFFNTIRIDLEDLETGIITNIRENHAYSFQAETGDNANRFLIHFNGVTALDELADENAPNVYAVEDVIYINHAEEIDADIFIYNTNGQLVGRAQMSKENMKRVSVNGAKGIYLVTFHSEDAVYTKKVYIK